MASIALIFTRSMSQRLACEMATILVLCSRQLGLDTPKNRFAFDSFYRPAVSTKAIGLVAQDDDDSEEIDQVPVTIWPPVYRLRTSIRKPWCRRAIADWHD
jgi:hypothetical protein